MLPRTLGLVSAPIRHDSCSPLSSRMPVLHLFVEVMSTSSLNMGMFEPRLKEEDIEYTDDLPLLPYDFSWLLVVGLLEVRFKDNDGFHG